MRVHCIPLNNMQHTLYSKTDNKTSTGKDMLVYLELASLARLLCSTYFNTKCVSMCVTSRCGIVLVNENEPLLTKFVSVWCLCSVVF